jgi:hypothetical protein
MRLVTMMCIALIAGISFPMMAVEQNLEGFQETRWGMTEDQIQEIYHGKLEHWTKIIEGIAGLQTKKYPVFGLQHYDIDQCDFSVRFAFTQKRLAEVVLDLNDMTRLDCRRTIIDILLRKYGAPAIVDRPSRALSSEGLWGRTWFLGSTMVREVDAFFQATSKNMLAIFYEPTQTPGAKKL